MTARRLAMRLAVLLAAIAIAPGAGEAHALKLFAVAEGATISGTAYFGGASRARGARIVAYGPDNAVLAESVTDDNGAFALPAAPGVDHRIVADSGDGHSAEFTIRAAEIAPQRPPAGAGRPEPEAAGAIRAAMAAPPDAALEATLEAVVARHVTPLRQQLNAYEDRVRWHDVLGGIGYIFGLTGIAAYLLSRRRS